MRGKRMLARMKILRFFASPKEALDAVRLMGVYGMQWDATDDTFGFASRSDNGVYMVRPWTNQCIDVTYWFCMRGDMRTERGDFMHFDTPMACAAAQILLGVPGDNEQKGGTNWGNKMFINRPTHYFTTPT